MRDELQHHARGCYSACSSVRGRTENVRIICFQPKSCVLWQKNFTETKYPKEKLTKAWKNIMFNQFRDILGGCSVKIYDDTGYLYGEAMSISEQALNFAMQKISLGIDTLEEKSCRHTRRRNLVENMGA